MSGHEVIFAIVFAVAGVAGALVVSSRNVVHAALFLVAALGSIAGLFLLLGAEFIGWTQILIYVGAIVVLLLFGIMLTKAPMGRMALDNPKRGMAFIVAAGTFGGLTWLIWDAFGEKEIPLNTAVRTADIGRSMFDRFVLPFEAISVLLLAALVGAIVLARKD
ncbi:MAG TPA: NADH-quinone oxidoreductase subunit J [Actinomycetota bacterium]|nr:NADH-quinone oxidoreductase subunit J [Actinomycetota bacterium]